MNSYQIYNSFVELFAGLSFLCESEIVCWQRKRHAPVTMRALSANYIYGVKYGALAIKDFQNYSAQFKQIFNVSISLINRICADNLTSQNS